VLAAQEQTLDAKVAQANCVPGDSQALTPSPDP
jgi:hypothetical protein